MSLSYLVNDFIKPAEESPLQVRGCWCKWVIDNTAMGRATSLRLQFPVLELLIA